ncbi:peptidoglycan DD-metalloendopeptidase family protein [Orenia marismortui]|uniref:Murein DD-endopeptidase MepM/ murein hydrolase activator NlpD n=1 Tax=Orenia marismortui TaxID=46469 RepID=A0A4R8GZT0_9FIRM|nr:peptidoglycan DD-metalloendopeptidase family protein [Orenia marismortui]TDX52385.1 murein DD-endopeptidase MepM/ murein hydrolase activator NlpD [Orenia marismortui]
MNLNKSALFILLLMFVSLIIPSPAQGQQRVLQVGMKGSDVQELQENLVMLGERLIIDGIFGPSTKQAIINLQKKAELPVDGVVGSETRIIIKEALNYDEHTVEEGDTLSELAIFYKAPIKAIKEANKLTSNNIIVGQELIIPKNYLGGNISTDFYDIISYKIKRGDSLEKISKKFNTTIRTIKKLNNLESYNLKAGETIKVSKLVLDLSNASKNTSKVKKDFIWPVFIKGRISSDYGWRIHPILKKKSFHKGVDIALPTGTLIKAIKAGKILSSGWIRGFGKTVTIDHGNGVVSLYGHNSQLLIKAGQKVNQGQIIAKSGNTGRSTGPHLEFRMMINGKAINPHKYIN